MAEFVLHINEIDELGKDYSMPVRAAWMRDALAAAEVGPDPDRGDGQLTLHAQRNGLELLLQGHLKVAAVTPCVRCLADAHFEVDTDLVGLLRVMDTHGGRGHDDDGDGADGDNLDPRMVVGDTVQLDDWVRENIVLEMPMRPVCGDDCNGLEVPAHIRPPEDFGGAEKGVDPRLLPLMKLKDKVRPKE